MKVVHAYNQHRGGGGSDNSTRTTIEVLLRRGIDVEVFTRNSEDLPRNLRGRWQAATSALYPGPSVNEFASLLDSFQPHVVHVHEVFPLVSPWILPLCSRRRIPVVMTCVDYRMTCPIVTHLRDNEICTRCVGGREYWAVLNNCRHNLPESFTVAFYNVLVRRLGLFRRHVTRYIAPSEFTREWLISHAAIDPARITVVSPVVRIPEEEFDAAQGSHVGYAGRLTPEKGVQLFLEAMRLSPGVPFRLARAQNSLVGIQLSADTDVTITRGYEDLSAFFRSARMLVMPSIWFEAFGLTAAEAMAHGVPIVASRLGALSYLVRDGIDGLLFEPGNTRDLSEKITRLWQDRDLCRQLGRAARQKAASSWTADQHFERLRAIYESVCADR